MTTPLQPGLEGRAELVVGDAHLASAVGSGLVRVFSTPMLVALMESAAVNALAPVLTAGHTSVGTRIDVRHLAATPPGMRVTAFARLVEVTGRVLVFEVWADDARERVGSGRHERAIVDQARFEQKVAAKGDGMA